MKSLILIDAKNCLFRYGWVHRALQTKAGKKTGAIYGFLTCLLRLKKKFPESRFVCVWDGENTRNSWRAKLYAGYKSNRKLEPSQEVQDVLGQIYSIEKVLRLADVAQIRVPEVEADDVIGVIVSRCPKDWQPVVYSSDQDYYQLIERGAIVLNASDKTCTPVNDKLVRAKYRCSIPDLLKVRALLGDKSDCIPRAVSGVGEVAAGRYIQAGLDPASLQPPTGPEFARLRPFWPRIHLNYILLRILDGDCNRLSRTQKEILDQEVGSVLADLPYVAVADKKQLLNLLADLELAEAISRRQEIFGLQHF